jgi:hypothetical protein
VNHMTTKAEKKANREKQKRFRENRKKDGLKELRVRIPPENLDLLKKYVTRKGGTF